MAEANSAPVSKGGWAAFQQGMNKSIDNSGVNPASDDSSKQAKMDAIKRRMGSAYAADDDKK